MLYISQLTVEVGFKTLGKDKQASEPGCDKGSLWCTPRMGGEKIKMQS